MFSIMFDDVLREDDGTRISAPLSAGFWHVDCTLTWHHRMSERVGWGWSSEACFQNVFCFLFLCLFEFAGSESARITSRKLRWCAA